jgi:hypothetical protein
MNSDGGRTSTAQAWRERRASIRRGRRRVSAGRGRSSGVIGTTRLLLNRGVRLEKRELTWRHTVQDGGLVGDRWAETGAS